MIDAKAFGLELAGIVKAQLDPLVSRLDLLEKQVAAIPAPIDLSAELSALKAAVEAIDIPEIPPAPALPDIASMVSEAVNIAVSALPVPKDGKSIELTDVLSHISAEVEKQVASLPVAECGKDGVGVAGALIDREGNLVLTLSNGETKSLGLVIGKDGKDGEDGNPGAGIDDFDAKLLPDGRTIAMTFNGKDYEYTVELAFPTMIYRGVYREGEFAKGDTVTWAGSLWHCDAEKTVEKPGDGSDDWTLCAKKGRDGKDGSIKPEKVFEPVRVGVPSEAR